MTTALTNGGARGVRGEGTLIRLQDRREWLSRRVKHVTEVIKQEITDKLDTLIGEPDEPDEEDNGSE